MYSCMAASELLPFCLSQASHLALPAGTGWGWGQEVGAGMGKHVERRGCVEGRAVMRAGTQAGV
jgi:hypothetical protein